MKKIVISIKSNALIFKYKLEQDIDKDKLMNTNIITNNELSFSSEYIIDNGSIVSTFLKELCSERKINKIVIDKFDMFKILYGALLKLDIDYLYISDLANFTYEAYEIIVKINKFKIVSCYSIPTYMIELFDKVNIKVESRAEILFTSNFMEDNNLISYSKIYYKTSIKLSPPLFEQDISDFETFTKINKYLKVIQFDVVNLDALDKIFKILHHNRLKNIKISIHDNITSKEIIEKLKKLKKEYLKYKINLELMYTEEYVKKNYIKQLILTTLGACAIISLLILGGSFTYVILNNKKSEENVMLIKEQIEEKISQDNLEKEEEPQIDPESIEEPTVPVEEPKKETTTNPKLKKVPIERMASLKELNSDTVGWLTVPDTNIDYPVVQTSDNEFYLNHNYNKDKDYNGWVFMNYYNVPDDLDKNTILFAHNRYYSGVMFGTLSRVTKKEWYEHYKEKLISYSTMYEELNFEVFSIYSIDVTNDYLKTIFRSDDEWNEFIGMIKQRSIFQSDTKIGQDDKILTLSTCLDNDKRLVVHAVLKK